jgi:hypothetical protein
MKRIKAFFDTEFTGLHKNTTLISIGVTYDDGHYFYAELTDYDKSQIDGWLEDNVISNLTLTGMEENTYKFDDEMKAKYVRGTKEFVAQELNFWHEYLFHTQQIEMWSDCLSYDWVLFNDLFGHAFNIPKNIYYIPFDICTLFKVAGVDPDISREDYSEYADRINKHNALYDAFVIMACYNKLERIITGNKTFKEDMADKNPAILRSIEKWEKGNWKACRMKNLKSGDLFRFSNEPDIEFIAIGDPYINDYYVWGISSKVSSIKEIQDITEG